MLDQNSTSPETSKPFSLARFIIVKSLVLILICVALGVAQSVASPRSYNVGQPVGFKTGFLHGVLLPAALPALLTGSDSTIYTNDPASRLYKLGYICGINFCGMLFFGFAYWRPPVGAVVRKKSAP